MTYTGVFGQPQVRAPWVQQQETMYEVNVSSMNPFQKEQYGIAQDADKIWVPQAEGQVGSIFGAPLSQIFGITNVSFADSGRAPLPTGATPPVKGRDQAWVQTSRGWEYAPASATKPEPGAPAQGDTEMDQVWQETVDAARAARERSESPKPEAQKEDKGKKDPWT